MNLFSTAVIQFDCVGHALWATQQIAELTNGSTFPGTRINDREWLIVRRAQERRSMSDSFGVRRVKSTPHLGG